MAQRLAKHMSGIAGEYLVAAELTRRGYVASLTLRNTKDIDILASTPDGARQGAIQVKRDQTSPDWILTSKAETIKSPNLFYVFVRLHDGGTPDYFVVPSLVVAEATAQSHKAWLSKPSRTGKPHKDNKIRAFADREAKYRDAWHLLGLG